MGRTYHGQENPTTSTSKLVDKLNSECTFRLQQGACVRAPDEDWASSDNFHSHPDSPDGKAMIIESISV